MNIRRFVAADMREALAAIRTELGADAVMLSTKKVPTGVEVIAAIDYDEGLWEAQQEPAAATAAPAVAPASASVRAAASTAILAPAPVAATATILAPAPARASVASLVPAPSAALADADDGIVESGADDLDEFERAAAAIRNAALQRAVLQAAVSQNAARDTATHAARPAAPGTLAIAAAESSSGVADEIKDLRRLLETQLASLAWNDLNRDAPVRARLLREMAKFGVDASLAQKLAAEIPPDLGAQEALRALVRRFGDALPLAQTDITDRGGIFAFLGPTGVGKTTTIAKIAARFVLRHGVDALGLVSTDTYRIGARQQLSNYARILRAPLHVAETSEELRRILDSFQGKKLVLIDTAGMSQRDIRLANQFATLRVEGHRVEPVLVLSAGADRGCLSEALRVFQAATPESLVITKLDEAAALGGVLSLAIRAGLPISYLSDGQRVPEDLHLAAPKRFWLMHNAVKLTQGTPPLDENELAVNFGEMELTTHA
jgi:flagellar biosynthesis protein FlhF